MKVKPKEVLINMPVVLMFENNDKINEFAANVNTILHGKVRVKCEELGKLGEQYAGLFYLQRNGEYHELRATFLNMIEGEEVNQGDLFRHLEKAADSIESKPKIKHKDKKKRNRQIYCSFTPDCTCDDCLGNWQKGQDYKL